jgi:CxxC motif-containing protein (DUF1111 family)
VARAESGPRALRCAAAFTLALGASCAPESAHDADLAQGGDLTVFDNTSSAFDRSSPPVLADEHLHARWLNGDKLWGTDRVASSVEAPPPDGTGGLGPLYVGKSCSTCHAGGGRTKSTLFTHGGTGFDFSSQLVFLRTQGDQTWRSYGRVLHDHGTFGVQPEGRLQVKYTLVDDQAPVCWENEGRCDVEPAGCSKWLLKPTATEPRGYCLIRERAEQCRSFEDGTPYCLLTPHYRITDWSAEVIPMDRLRYSVRTPLRHLGLGLMLAVDPEELKALAAREYPEYGISGKLQWVYEQGRWVVGVSGHKAQHGDLTVELGFSSDLGVTSTRYPEEIAQGQPQAGHDFGIEISTADMADVDLYLRGSGVPARRNQRDPQVLRGEALFTQAKCQLCHAPTLHTGPEVPRLLDGTPLPMLARQTIHPYSDYLLHDMGPALGDEYDQFEARGDEWRTAPLWGTGLQDIVSGHTHVLHDARARNLTEAIMWHFGGEGAVSASAFSRLSGDDRAALLAFLNSL